jgi:predicted Zn-dependent protease
MKKIGTFFLIIFFFVSCSSVPITGRKRVNFVSDSEVLPTSFAHYKDFLEENTLSKNKIMTRQVKDVGKNISTAVDVFMRANKMISEADSYEWEFNLIDDDKVNAWCMPGGKVVFYTGIIPICLNEDGIAAVMGHEIAHAFAKHGQERMSQSKLQQLSREALALGTSKKSETAKQIWNTSFGIGTGLGMLKFSRVHEQEADRLGLIFMLMAGYDGAEAAHVWSRMSSLSEGKSSPEILSTHPSNSSRIEDLKNYLPTAKKMATQFMKKANTFIN